MPHDRKGRQLAVGNLVLMLAVLTEVNASDTCNFTARIFNPGEPAPKETDPWTSKQISVVGNCSVLDLLETEEVENAARVAYETYAAAVGGKSYNGDPLPTWEVLNERTKAQPGQEEPDEEQAKAAGVLKGWREVGQLLAINLAKLDLAPAPTAGESNRPDRSEVIEIFLTGDKATGYRTITYQKPDSVTDEDLHWASDFLRSKIHPEVLRALGESSQAEIPARIVENKRDAEPKPQDVPADIAETKGWRRRLDDLRAEFGQAKPYLTPEIGDELRKIRDEIEDSSHRQSEERQIAAARIDNVLGGGTHQDRLMYLKEAIMWLGMDLKAINDDRPGAAPTPYPSSYDPKSAKIEPTSEGLFKNSPQGEAAFVPMPTVGGIGQPATTSTGTVQDPSGRTQSADHSSPTPAAAPAPEANQ